ncbi:juvenile hormone esterase-like [Schistocerca serialis cubense]|uniref:juvenile hormone esterase-like n=1 Tax=Schistocerca serialis cubense TaxID=2023355 RepID=UPI00214EEB5B|nr:juvenile hormone esterase-like [Schistocerca serialis cubense]
MARVGGAVTVTIPQGTLRGRKAKTPSGRAYTAFQAIPYALPPVGPLRFKSPEPPEKWSGIRNATVEPNVAPQMDVFFGNQYKGGEDCLYLNVYTPKLPTGASAKLLPVMVWIHGGAFMMGSGNTDLYGPEHLLEHDIVLVTLNYRVGVLGFLSTGDEVIPGNVGLKDQVMALKWVKSNIANFGGDPQNVTIFGESAGAMSCHLLQISPAAKGLFHKVICQSGVASLELVSAPIKDRTFRLAQSLGFTGDSSEELLAFMRDQPVQKLVENVLNCLTKESAAAAVLSPAEIVSTLERPAVLDCPTDNREVEDNRPHGASDGHSRIAAWAFPSRRAAARNGKCSSGCFHRNALPELTENKGAMRELNTNFQRLLPASIPVKREERITIARDIKRFYFENQPLEDSTVEMYADLRGDLVFVYPALVAARVQSAVAGAQPVYFYQFDVVTNLNMLKKVFTKEDIAGASHGDDIPYLFSGEMFKDIPKGPETVEGKAIARMTRMWTNFATKGNPTPDPEDPILSVTWTPVKKDNLCYLNVTKDGLSVEKDLIKERMDFWDKLYRLRA